MPIFGPNFAERIQAADRIRVMLPLLDRCLAGRYSLKMLVGVRRGIELMVDEIRDNPVQRIDA
jgi:hypothetical protein